MTRLVSRVNFAPGERRTSGPRPFSEFAESANLVLLGDPGAGKSHLFREAASAEGSRFLTVRAFLVTPQMGLAGQNLFIDGLDERRAGRGDRDTVDRLVERLFAVEPGKVRISCRAADWLGETDLAALGLFFDSRGETPVLVLQSLSAEEQIAVLVGRGSTIDQAQAFLTEASARSLTDFLQNPQNLIMLWEAVQAGNWPATRRELFELSTGLMLRESNQDRARSGAGVFSAEELRPVAGAFCAARLISDIEAVSLSDQEGTPEIPSYRSLALFASEMVQAALNRRVFVAGVGPESADYAHRTTAEYLASAYLAVSIRNGLPFGRVAALMGVDGHPAPELRGLHAWLAIHLPERADQIIDADPYGVLTYGDAAPLTPSSRAHLLQALARLSEADPWFRSENWQAPSIGALAQPDMVERFREILRGADAGFGIRSVVVDAIQLGSLLPELIPDLAYVLSRDASPFAERNHALHALLRFGEDGKGAILEVYRAGLGRTVNGLRLRAEIIRHLYGGAVSASDVIALVNDMLTADERIHRNILWRIDDKIPISDLPSVLDGIQIPPGDNTHRDARRYEAGRFYATILARAWRKLDVFEPDRALNWLRTYQALDGNVHRDNARHLQNSLIQTPERGRLVSEYFLRTMPISDEIWLNRFIFRAAMVFIISTDDLLDIVVEHLNAAEIGSDRQSFLYELALDLAMGANQPHGEAIFAELYDFVDTCPDLAAVRDARLVFMLPDKHLEIRSSVVSTTEENTGTLRESFERDAEYIRNGESLDWLAHLARIYFALCFDVDRALNPRERLVTFIGEANTEIALAGFRAALSRSDVPTFNDVMTLLAEHRQYDWWHALIAGLNERWAAQPPLNDLTDDTLKALLAFDLANPVSSLQDGTERWLVHPWRQALLEQRPGLVRDAYFALARSRLERDEEHAEGLHELLSEASFEEFRDEIVVAMLSDFPNASPFRLADLLGAAVKRPAIHGLIIPLSRRVMSGTIDLAERQRDLWLATAYILSPNEFEREVECRACANSGLIFDLRDRSGLRFGTQIPEREMSLQSLEFLARLTGRLFPEVPHPEGGWGGSTNPWDASDFCHRLINMISAVPSAAATNALERLEADANLASYLPYIRHALANQRRLRRDAEYDRPDWQQTVRALSNGAPATVADLHALLLEHLRDTKRHIERANTDIYKNFWNLDSYGRPINPRPEEICRDVLVEMLRQRLLPLQVTVEPEGHMVADRRADIVVAMPGRKILCELKRDYHQDVWTAAVDQLERFYVHDPEAHGFGVYGVFWYGDRRPTGIPNPKGGRTRPQSASEMEQMLKDLVPADRRSRIAVVVIDVSGQM